MVRTFVLCVFCFSPRVFFLIFETVLPWSMGIVVSFFAEGGDGLEGPSAATRGVVSSCRFFVTGWVAKDKKER